MSLFCIHLGEKQEFISLSLDKDFHLSLLQMETVFLPSFLLLSALRCASVMENSH